MPSRNDPCPCGSGRKYKACHMREDQIAARTEALLGDGTLARAEEQADEAARRAPFWEADVAPLTVPFQDMDEPGALVLLAAGGMILVADTLPARPVGVQARARSVLAAVMAGGRRAGLLPERLHVRDAALADALRPELEARGITPMHAPLPEVDDALRYALEQLAGSPAGGAASRPWTWADTEASPGELAEFHAAAAAYHRAAPWEQFHDSEVMLLTFPGSGEAWSASVMGAAGIYYGLALYSEPMDAILLRDDSRSGEFVEAMRGFTLSLSYDAAHALPKPMRRELATSGWEVAGPDAYPTLVGVGVPGRRLTAHHLQRAALAARAVAAFAEAGDVELPWRDPATGVEVHFMGSADENDGGAVRLPWPPLEVSHLVGPAGPKADLDAVLRDEWEAVCAREDARLTRFVRWLDARKLSRAAHTRLVRTAEMWTEMLASYGVPAQSATEYDLRLFLYGYVTRFQSPPKPVAKHLTRSLARIFEFYAEREGIEYPWASFVLHELDTLAAGADDVREVLQAVGELFAADLLLRALRPVAAVPGTPAGWSMVFGEATANLREELHRRWLAWHDEVVRGGITDPDDVRDVLVGRQRQWENTPHARMGGRTPKQVLMEANQVAAEGLSGGA